MNEENKSLKETLANISKNLEELKSQKKVKSWSLPFASRSLSKKKKRQGYVVFQNIGQNKAVTFIKAPIEDGVAMVNGIPHPVEPEDILLWKNKLPMVIMPQWSERPFSAKDHFAKAKECGKTTEGWELIINYILKTQIKDKKKFGAGLIIVGILVLVGLGAYAIKSGAFS